MAGSEHGLHLDRRFLLAGAAGSLAAAALPATVVACTGDHSRKVGSFLLVSEGGVEGPYSQRWTAGVGAGHNNFFADHDGHLWATFFRNPASGYWSAPSRVADAAVPGVVRLEWTGPTGNRLYVQRR
jgi:hypothetical protein